jgi:dolichyl-phosphate-mannose-protein mannosyltransferase
MHTHIGCQGDWWVVVDVQDVEGKRQPPRPVLHGQIVAFRHNLTGKMLHSHDVAAPLSNERQEASCLFGSVR